MDGTGGHPGHHLHDISDPNVKLSKDHSETSLARGITVVQGNVTIRLDIFALEDYLCIHGQTNTGATALPPVSGQMVAEEPETTKALPKVPVKILELKNAAEDRTAEEREMHMNETILIRIAEARLEELALLGLSHLKSIINERIAEIEAILRPAKPAKSAKPRATKPNGGRNLSPAARKRIAAAQTKRWKQWHAAQKKVRAQKKAA